MSAIPEVLSMQSTSGRIRGSLANRDGEYGEVATSTPLPHKNSRLVFLTDPTGLAAEQYKLLRRRLCALHPGGGIVLVTSPGPGEGKTLTALNLAWCLADGGSKTIVIDLDLREPAVLATLQSSHQRGLSDLLAGNSDLPECLIRIGDRPMHVLGLKDRLESISSILNGTVLSALLATLRLRAKWVFVDVPPILPFADVAELLPQMDGAILVVRAHKTAGSLVEPALELLKAKLWGVILNDSPIAGDPYYGYGDYSQRLGKR